MLIQYRELNWLFGGHNICSFHRWKCNPILLSLPKKTEWKQELINNRISIQIFFYFLWLQFFILKNSLKILDLNYNPALFCIFKSCLTSYIYVTSPAYHLIFTTPNVHCTSKSLFSSSSTFGSMVSAPSNSPLLTNALVPVVRVQMPEFDPTGRKFSICCKHLDRPGGQKWNIFTDNFSRFLSNLWTTSFMRHGKLGTKGLNCQGK